MATKQIALGTLLKTDAVLAATFATHTLVKEINPPQRTREKIEGKDLGDTFDVPLLGIEQESEMTFTQYWHPTDSVHAQMDTEFGASTSFSVQIIYPFSTPITDEFTVKVVKLGPAALSVGGTIQREVTFLRTSAITRT